MCETGARVIGSYSFCTTSTKSIGIFIPNEKAKPHIGKKINLNLLKKKN